MKEVNAEIEKVAFQMNHGILVPWLFMKTPSGSQGFGGYDLRKEDFLYRYMSSILQICAVESFEELLGIAVRIRIEGGTIVAIGHVLKDKWFTPAELWEIK